MSRHRLISKRSYRIWMGVNAVLLLLFSGGVLYFTVGGGFRGMEASARGFATPDPTASRQLAARIPTKQQVLDPNGKYFGLSTPQAPWSESEINGIAGKAGKQPNLLEYFVNWTEDFRPQAVVASYQQGAVPAITWEPWAGLQGGTSQPAYGLEKIVDGGYDGYVTRFATAVKQQKWPIVLRFGHEMNGNWYPWSESKSGNKAGDYVKAWRHVHDIFTKVGATNVIWVWSPNIVRPVPSTSLHPLYPGDRYVDWIGMVGYAADEETRASQTFEETILRLRTFTHKKILITETGAGPGKNQAKWTTAFFNWLTGRDDVVGFVWFEYNKESTGTKDWRFTVNSDTLDAFRTGVHKIRVARPVKP
ncbi:MAG TPA: glycosyl hydrolase [Actinocatenispora sp.]